MNARILNLQVVFACPTEECPGRLEIYLENEFSPPPQERVIECPGCGKSFDLIKITYQPFLRSSVVELLGRGETNRLRLSS